MENLLRDVRVAVRAMAKSPVFTLAAIGTLSLCIGANTAVFSVVNPLIIRPLPFGEPDRIMAFEGVQFGTNGTEASSSSTTAPRWFNGLAKLRPYLHSFEDLAIYSGAVEGANLSGDPSPERVTAAEVGTNLFALLRVRPEAGRFFLSGEDQPGANRVAVLSYRLWKRRFGGDSGLVGGTILLDGTSYTVVGVAPKEMQFPNRVDLWLPASFGPGSLAKTAFIARIIGRLKPGATLREAQAEVDSYERSLQRTRPLEFKPVVFPLKQLLVGDTRPALLMLSAAVLLVLLIGCINVANLLLARAAIKSKEIAVRAALGASRRRLIQQSMVESLLLSLLGGLLGLLVASAGVDVLKSLASSAISGFDQIKIDFQALAFAFAISVLSGLVFGLTPALKGSKADLIAAMSEGRRGNTKTGSNKLNKILVAVEIAASLMLLAGAGLLVESLVKVQNIDPGFNPRNVLTASLSLPSTMYPTLDNKLALFEQAIQRIRTLPGVEFAGAAEDIPLATNAAAAFDFSIEGRPPFPADDAPYAVYNSATPGFFSAMGMKPIEGRYFTDEDTKGSEPVIIINQKMAREFWPKGGAVGARLKLENGGPVRRIVGVVPSTKVFGIEDAFSAMQTYVPSSQAESAPGGLAIRYKGNTATLILGVRAEIKRLDPDLPLYNVKTMEDVLAASTAPRRLNTLLLSIFSVIALVLAATGVYGVTSCSVAQRTQEIGIRVAIGATPGNVLWLVAREGLVPTLVGAAAGIGGALALSKLISKLLYDTAPRDPQAIAVVTALLILVALVASVFPARRAISVDPIQALRSE